MALDLDMDGYIPKSSLPLSREPRLGKLDLFIKHACKLSTAGTQQNSGLVQMILRNFMRLIFRLLTDWDPHGIHPH